MEDKGEELAVLARRETRSAVTQAPARRCFRMGSVCVRARVQGGYSSAGEEQAVLLSQPCLHSPEAGAGVVMLSLAIKELALGLELKRNSCEK